ncbi:dethiobiotin synthase [Saccharicrinis fermentans]|uniref:ATP-dependent dethiobiotin synthetase BioD n=1 Tax=Saccharicrinis fermentans DSM 9555 = JCM 21142 TaxID=869213 RepID=W7Y875_9BACT|nr:dethiobiotin synthase [Saccharicrinis fermentans]GAF04462.1 ATP-dependent dethiobiotin synthetase BioD 1 [Saccharicrinis fermentans DSM 9555 = JCM 21142]
MHKQIFISGIDTDCGKTHITGLLAYHFRKAGINCITTKMVQTGCEELAEDIIAHRNMMEMDLLPVDKKGETCPVLYSFPASPHLAAEIDQRPFEVKKVEKAFVRLQKQYELLLTEGAGGLAVPLSNNLLLSDFLQTSALPLVLVSSSRLGSINHTLLSIDFCINNQLHLTTIVYNQFPEDDRHIAESSYQFLKDYLARSYSFIKLIHSDELSKSTCLSEQLINYMLSDTC